MNLPSTCLQAGRLLVVNQRLCSRLSPDYKSSTLSHQSEFSSFTTRIVAAATAKTATNHPAHLRSQPNSFSQSEIYQGHLNPGWTFSVYGCKK